MIKNKNEEDGETRCEKTKIKTEHASEVLYDQYRNDKNTNEFMNIKIRNYNIFFIYI